MEKLSKGYDFIIINNLYWVNVMKYVYLVNMSDKKVAFFFCVSSVDVVYGRNILN